MPPALDDETNAPAHRGLRAIAAVELIKSALALLAASGLEIFGPAPIRSLIGHLIEWLKFDAHHSALATLAHRVDPASVHLAAAVLGAYGVLHLIEAWGLWRGAAWASWLGCVSAGVYLPFECYALLRDPGWVASGVVAINLAIVWVLARDVWKRHGAAPAAAA